MRFSLRIGCPRTFANDSAAFKRITTWITKIENGWMSLKAVNNNSNNNNSAATDGRKIIFGSKKRRTKLLYWILKSLASPWSRKNDKWSSTLYRPLHKENIFYVIQQLESNIKRHTCKMQQNSKGTCMSYACFPSSHLRVCVHMHLPLFLPWC